MKFGLRVDGADVICLVIVGVITPGALRRSEFRLITNKPVPVCHIFEDFNSRV